MEGAVCQGCRERDARIAQLTARLADLEATVRALEAKLKDRTAPPPTPRPHAEQPPAPAKKATGRRRGAQPGHPPHLKQLLPPERVQRTVAFRPHACAACRAALPTEPGDDDPPPSRHQVAELPAVAATVTEYQGHFRTCPDCGRLNHAAIPANIKAHSIGPRLAGVCGYMSGALGMSKRNIEEYAETVFGVPLALGTVTRLEQEITAALATPYAEATEAVRAAAVKHVDETGWKENGRKRWLWVAAIGNVSVFLIHALRNAAALRALLGPALGGILCSDRWVVYRDWPDPSLRQLCWAHLKRNWEAMVERGGAARRVGEVCLAVERQVFELWHLFRGGGCTRRELEVRMCPLAEQLQETLHDGAECSESRTRRFCARLLAESDGLWTFVVAEGVEPTNNHAERVLRRAVVWRRRSYGCHSAAGCRFVERVLTVVQSLRLQKRCAVEYLRAAIDAHRNQQPAPKLVPAG